MLCIYFGNCNWYTILFKHKIWSLRKHIDFSNIFLMNKCCIGCGAQSSTRGYDHFWTKTYPPQVAYAEGLIRVRTSSQTYRVYAVFFNTTCLSGLWQFVDTSPAPRWNPAYATEHPQDKMLNSWDASELFTLLLGHSLLKDYNFGREFGMHWLLRGINFTL